MNTHPFEQLDKVLALTDSDQDGEALVAVRMARRLLSRNGLNFSDLARAAVTQRPRINLPFSIFQQTDPYQEQELAQLRQQVADLKAEINTYTVQNEFWRRRATELEQNLTQTVAQSTRWRELARETVEKLWDLGQSIKLEEFDAQKPALSTPETRKIA